MSGLDVAHCSAVILVFAMEGCSACEDYKPRLEREVQRWRAQGAPFVFAEPGRQFTAQEIPLILYDAQSPHPQIQQLGDEFKVEALPTTILFRRHHAPHVIVGSISDQQIYDLLQSAARG